MTSEPSGRGRPRDESIDERVFDAVEKILREDGLNGLSMERVAKVAGIGKQTLYRRYPTRLPLLVDFMRQVSEQRAPAEPVVGQPRPSIRQVLTVAYGFASSPTGRAVMRALMAEATNDETARALVHEQFVARRRQLLTAVIIDELGIAENDAKVLTELAFGFMWSRLALDGAGSEHDLERVIVLLGLTAGDRQ